MQNDDCLKVVVMCQLASPS